MSENSNIEDFFRKRFESQDFAFRESDWEKLEKRMDEEGFYGQKPINGFPWKNLLLVVVIASVFMLGWFSHELFTKQNKPEGQINIASTSSVLPTHLNNETEKTKQKITIVEQKLNTNVDIVPSEENNKHSEIKKNQPENAPQIRATEDKFQINNTQNKIATKDIFQEVLITKDRKTNGNKVHFSDEKALTGTTNPDDKNQIAPNNSVISFQYLKPINSDILPIHINFEYLPFLSSSIVLDDTRINKPTSIPFSNRWMFGISLASDFNSIGMFHEKSLSAKIGTHFYFSISHNWWVSAGIQYSNKKYNTSAEYYSPGNGYWNRRTNGVLPDNIFGTCSVFDVPVMLTYRFYEKNFISFTVSAGASNYFLQDEIYEFEFEQDNPGAAPGWYTAENTNALFSFGNLALGVEWQTSLRTILVLEPFLQVPFKEVGWGNVMLYSTGLQAKIKYRLGNAIRSNNNK